MIVSCNKNCKNFSTTTAKVDIENDCVLCDSCGDVLTEVSSYTKAALKNLGFVIKPKKKAFTFPCITCNKNVEVGLKDNKPYGVGCENSCKFNLTDYYINTALKIKEDNKESDNDEEER